MRLGDFKAMTFDVYGTLIDWEAGLLAELKPWMARGGVTLSDDQALEVFGTIEPAVQAENPGLRYPDVLAETHRRLARRLDIKADEAAALALGASIPRWPAFPDSAVALGHLKNHFVLAVLSNVDDASVAHSVDKLGKPFHHIFTAQQIGSYKPDRRNFEYATAKLGAAGIAKGKILHVAQSLYHDHVPANAVGLAGAWIDRRAGRKGGGATSAPKQMPRFDFRFDTLGQLADAHKAELARR